LGKKRGGLCGCTNHLVRVALGLSGCFSVAATEEIGRIRCGFDHLQPAGFVLVDDADEQEAFASRSQDGGGLEQPDRWSVELELLCQPPLPLKLFVDDQSFPVVRDEDDHLVVAEGVKEGPGILRLVLLVGGGFATIGEDSRQEYPAGVFGAVPYGADKGDRQDGDHQ